MLSKPSAQTLSKPSAQTLSKPSAQTLSKPSTQTPMSRIHDTRPLSGSNHNVETNGTLANPSLLWVDWIWKADPEEPFEPSVLMNRSHLLGLLACRHMSTIVSETGADIAVQRTKNEDERMTLVSKQPRDFTLRELRDTVDNLLIEWPKFVERLSSNPRAAENLQAVASLIDGCFARLGYLAQRPADARIFNDAACTEPHTKGLMRLSRPGLRRLLGSFMALYRHVDILSRAERVELEPVDCQLRKHHVEASTDDFHMMCMHMLLPVAAKLNYKQDFPGMYNHVSQVIYFHNSQYERTPRLELQEILETGNPMHCLPAICQIYPDIELMYEEDPVDLSQPTGKWRWLVVPKRVYLVGPDSRIYYNENVLSLLNIHKTETQSRGKNKK
jgi:hypothetical protein